MSPFALCYFLANWDGNLSANAECFHLFFFLSTCSEYLFFFTNCFIDQWMMILEMLIHCCLDRDITVGRLFSQSSLPSSILHYVTVQILLFGKAWSQKKFGVILEHIEELHAFVEDQFCIFFFQDLDCFYMVAFNSYLHYSVYMCPNFRDFHFNLVDSLPYKWNWILHKF